LAAKHGRRFMMIADPRVTLSTVLGDENSPQGWYSSDYGECVPAPVLIGKTFSQLPDRFPWVIWPGPPEQVKMSQLGQSSTWILETATHREHFIFPNRGLEKWNTRRASDADLAFLKQTKDGTVERLTLLDGSRIDLPGIRFTSYEAVRHFDLTCQDTLLEIRMWPASPFTLEIGPVTSVMLNGRRSKFVCKNGTIAVQVDK
jgi:hypothetical protein